MVLKTYTYTVSAKNFPSWTIITGKANAIYKEHGCTSMLRGYIKKGNRYSIFECEQYANKKEALRISRAVDNDPRIKKLFDEFLKVVTDTVEKKEITLI